ncbi:hypothetical protein EC988_004384 [Linderina pennispora]|nr:hypothetical protein EC988_004384 [Linderina pennispora]
MNNAASERPTFLGIHARNASTQILYISSGCQQAMGYSPQYMISKNAKEFIADPYAEKYPEIYDGAESDDDASAYVMYMNVRCGNGDVVLHRVTTFKCDNCIIVVGVAFPELPFQDRHLLEVQTLDGAMRRLNLTATEKQDRELAEKRRQVTEQGRVPLYFASQPQVKAAFVLENPQNQETDESGRRQNGSLVVFVTGSISKIIDADTSDLLRYPFMKLIAPEDILKASKFFDRLSDSPDVLVETFSLLEKPYIIEGDVLVPDEDNRRVVVECLGANVQDGVALLMRKLRVRGPPVRNEAGEWSPYKATVEDSDGGYLTLEEIISSDPETSDAPSWSTLR